VVAQRAGLAGEFRRVSWQGCASCRARPIELPICLIATPVQPHVRRGEVKALPKKGG
jgi:hypothetical protein